MSEDNALVAGQSGIATAGPPATTVPAPQSQDEVHRQSAACELAAYLASARTMLARCEAMSKAKRGDRLGPIHAAARLMNANAQVARALAHVALVESRRRVIVETIQPPAPKNAELNSRFLSPEDTDDARTKLQRRIEALVEAARRETARQEGLAAESGK